MHADSFDVLDVAVTAEAIFTPRAKLMFAVDLFWANFKRYREIVKLKLP